MALPDDPFLSIAERIMDKVILGNEILNLARFQDWVIAMLVDEVKKLDHVPTVEALETSLKDGFMKAIAIENFMQLVPFIFPALLTRLLEAEVAIVVSEEAKRTYRASKLDAARKLTVAGEYSIFVSGFADRLRASSFMSFPSPSAPAAPADGSFHSPEQVEVDAPAVATYGSMATLAEPTQAFRYKKMMTESELAAILRAVDKVEITDTVRRRHWSAVHEFHYLSRALEGSLWLLVWANLDKVCGGQLEQEQLLNTMIDLKQSSDESLSSFLGRVTRFRSQCRASGAMQMRDDSYYMMLSRRGMSSGAVASQAASITLSHRLHHRHRRSQDRLQLLLRQSSPMHHHRRLQANNLIGPIGVAQRSVSLVCWSLCIRVPQVFPANPKSGSGTEAVRVVGSTEGTVHNDERGETVILPSRSVVIRAWGDTHKLDGGILTATYGGKLVLKGLVDTGATDALLSKSVYDQIREHCPEVPSLIPCQATATLANGSTEEVVGTVKLDLIFCDRVVTHDYYVVKDLQPGIIWGLRLLGRVGVAIDIGDSAEGLRVTTRVKSPAEGDSEGITQPGIVTSLNADSEEIAVRKVSGLCCALSLEEAAPLLGEKSEDSLSSPVDTAVVHSFVPPSCNEMEFDWRPIPAAPQYDYRVRQANENDTLDLPGEQEYVCEIRWPPLKPRTDGTHVDYSKAMIARLSNEQKELLRKEVANYLAHQWWESPPPSDATAPSCSEPIIEVFPLQQSLLKSTRLRPVCDARSWNSILPSASYLGSDTSVLLTEMQLAINKLLLDGLSVSEIAVGFLDISRAFYRIHLGPGLRVNLSLGGIKYVSRRLIFGLSVAPSALESFVRRLIDLMYARGVSRRVHVFIYLDDICLVGTLHGFPFPAEKCNAFTIDSSEAIRHLGVFWKQYWHINRRELFCSVEALLCVGDLRLKEFGIESVVLESDSRVTCGWLRGRLLVIASDVRVRLQLPVVVRHIAAEINADADDLSRLAQLWICSLDDLFNSQRVFGADSKRVCMMCDHCIAAVIKGSIRVWKGNCLDHTVRSPWETVSADLAGPFVADSFNCVYCLLLCDHFFPFLLIATPPIGHESGSYPGYDRSLWYVRKYAYFYGPIEGAAFASRATQSSLEALGVRVRLVTPRAPWCNGLVERRVQELKVCLRGYGLSKSRSWSSKLGSATRRMNSVVLPDLGTTPFNIMFHRSMYLGSVVPPSSVDAAVDDDELPTADELKENDEGVLLQRDWVGKVRDDREQPPEDRRQLRPVSAGQKVLVKMADGWRGPRKVLIVHDDKASCDHW
ncbi:hypothetical protein FOZ60_014456 [Perkinsus olseni]|uniref:Integrase catalytic domain-containing protein n=1 Tax=Perkinsus olseni TaxID=32597 RepID=A0A7J6N7E7_PEROL|nr:hypothetical protein FOZ60_014456 [Perkinsus olseni]